MGVNFNFKYPFLYLCTALIGGILCSQYLTLPAYWVFVSLLTALFCRNIYSRAADLLLLLTVFLIGLQIAAPHTPQHSSDSVFLIKSRCEEVLPHHHYILSAGKQKFYLNHYHTDTVYALGDSLSFGAKILPFTYPKNPGEFSYAHYLKQKNVFSQVIPLTPIYQTGHAHNIHSVFYRLREKVMRKTSSLTPDTVCRMLVNALCLGYKTEIDPTLRGLFITTGTVHLLSVSGLHTGALYLFFLFILKHLGVSGRKKEILILPILWSYACLTGLAPSVVRASTILSFISVGKIFTRTYTPLNAVAASAFFTLSLQPSALYSMSFLLSYSAYTGILVLYPFLFRLPGTLPPLCSKIYACICVTIAAQIPTLPLSAFYFHTVNINSFLANLIAVPLATTLLYSSATLLLLPLFISRYLAPVCEWLCHTLIKFLQYFAPYSVNLQELYPSAFLIVLIYGGLSALFGYILFRKRHWLYATVTFCTVMLSYLMLQNIFLKNEQEIVVFHYPKRSAILLNYNGFYASLHNRSDSAVHSLPYVRQHKLKALPPTEGLLDSGLFWEGQQLISRQDTIRLMSPEFPAYSPCRTLIVLHDLLPEKITNFPEKQELLPSRILLDGSNSKYTQQRWQQFCQSHRIILQNTAETGYIRIPLK